MAKKQIKKVTKLEFIAGQAKPGPELASLGIDMGGFTKQFNDATKDRAGDVVPVIIKAYGDRSFDFELKTSPVSFLLKKYAKIEKGSQTPPTDIVGTVTKEQVEEIAKYKMPDLNTRDLKSSISMVEGTAKNMGIKIS